MPRKLKDEQGNEVEVYEKQEYEAITSELQSKLNKLEEAKKELEQEINPNWQKVRQELKEKTKAIDELQNKLKEMGVKPQETNQSFSAEEFRKIAAEEASRAFLSRERENALNKFGDKRKVVEDYFNRLSNGQELNPEKINQIAIEAARAAGIEKPVDRNLNSYAASSGTAPEFEEGKNDFSDTDQGKALASRLGIDITLPKK